MFSAPLKTADMYNLDSINDDTSDDTFMAKNKSINRIGEAKNTFQNAVGYLTILTMRVGKLQMVPKRRKGVEKGKHTKGRCMECHNCHKEGHIARDCPVPAQKVAAFKKEPTTFQLAENASNTVDMDDQYAGGSEYVEM